MKKIEVDIVCKVCYGTGVYQGFAEDENSAVVCYDCKGTGKYCYKFEYEEFTKRKHRDDIEWVYQTNCGIKVGQGDGYKYSDFGGMSYKDWLESGGKFPPRSEMRKSICPAWWNQNVDGSNKPDWCYKEAKFCLGAFSSCKWFDNKRECWARWDKEFGDEKEDSE